MKKAHISLKFKRITAFFAAAVMAFNSLPVEIADDININISFDFFKSISVSADNTAWLSLSEFKTKFNVGSSAEYSVIINSSDQLIGLSNVNPSEYADLSILYNLTQGGGDATVTAEGGYSFRGLGSEEYPFSGTFRFQKEVTLSAPLFNYIADGASLSFDSFSVNLNEGNSEGFCLFENVVKDKTKTGSYDTLSAEGITVKSDGESESFVIKGIVGSLGDGAEMSLGVTLDGGDSQLEIKSENAGLFCNTMGEASRLTLTDFSVVDGDTSQITVTAESGSAGGAVGVMGENSVLEINCGLQFKGTVCASLSAGGLVGKGANSVISAQNTVSVDSASVSGTESSGGLVGNYIYSGVEKSFDFGKITVAGVTLISEGSCGGLFGRLENQKGDFEISPDSVMSVTSTADSEIYGGVMGSYVSKALENSLLVKNVKTMVNSTASTVIGKNIGGLVGIVDCDSTAYAEFENVEVTSKSSLTGGLVGCAGEGNMLNIGSAKITTSSGKKLQGGLVGKADSGVIRLHGTTDLSGAKIASFSIENSVVTGQLLAVRTNGSVVYACGSGSDEISDSTDYWRFVRSNSNDRISDVGSYGEVVRLGGSLSEGSKGLFDFDSSAHTVTVARATDTISDLQDFAAVSVTLQAEEGRGALKLSSESTVNQNSALILKGDISLIGTGITGLNRDDGAQTFEGSLEGGGHTVTLAVGETFGIRKGSAAEGDGSGQIYNHTSIGLFARNKGTEIKNLTVNGSINFGMVYDGADVRVGALTSAVTSRSCAFTNVYSLADIIYDGDYKTSYVGGFIGYVEDGGGVDFSGCTWDGRIENGCTNEYFYNGGFIGFVSRNVAVTVSGYKSEGKTLYSYVSGSISTKSETANIKAGGLIGSMEIKDGAVLNTVDISDLTVDGLTVKHSGTTSGTAGGLFGYDWFSADVTIKRTVIKGCTLDAPNKRFGGLVYSASGYWQIPTDSSASLSFTGSNSFTGTTSADSPSALLVANGYDCYGRDRALYLELGTYAGSTGGALSFDEDNVTLNLTGETDYFDELVGISDNSAGNGVVSVATSNGGLIDTTESGCNTYKSHFGKSYKNGKTRYYYNLDTYRTNAQTNGEKMLVWSVYRYAESNIRTNFKSQSSFNIKGEIDLRGLSYYPVDISEKVSIKNATVIFDNSTAENIEAVASNKKTSDSDSQHYMMQCGLFNNISSKSSASTITVNGLTLQGNVGMTKSGSGAFACGTVSGKLDGVSTLITTLSLNDILLDGITVYNFDSDYAPLLVNFISDYSSVSLKGVTTLSDSEDESEYNSDGATVTAATSLMGKAGSNTATNISLSFRDMAVDARESAGALSKVYGTYKSIFSHSTFLESFTYPASSVNTCSGSYTFKKADTDVTYGKEIANTEGKAVSGRNNGEQYEYFDGGYVYDKESSLSRPTDSASSYSYFSSGYLRYVYKPQSGNQYEIDINKRTSDITEGCGTYGDPYIITDGAQLENLGSTSFNSNWVIRVSPTVMKNQDGSSGYHTSDNDSDDIYIQYNGSAWVQVTESGGAYTEKTGGYSYTEAAVRAYLLNAYYMIAPDPVGDDYGISLGGGSFMGIGNALSSQAFCGVIIGKYNEDLQKYPTVTVEIPEGTVTQFGGIVCYGLGCVVKDIIVEYDDNIVVSSLASSTDVSSQNFFGGVIGYVWGGDNIIDNVSVVYNGTVNTDTGTNSNLINIGGYVGLVGGDYKRGGTVIFRNMTDDFKLTSVDGTDITTEVSEGNDKYYRNPYVGRVLDAAVLYDGVSSSENKTIQLSNTDKNYTIPTISNPNSQVKVDIWSDDTVSPYATPTVTVSTAEELWLLSAVCASGAGAANRFGGYYHSSSAGGGNTASCQLESYYYGKVRSGTYGEIGTAKTAPDEIQYDEKAWGGIGYDSVNSDVTKTNILNKVPYIIRNFSTNLGKGEVTDFPAKRITGIGKWLNISISDDCDLTDYGNGFRGLGSSFTRFDKGSTAGQGYLQRKAICTKDIYGKAGGSVITMNRNVYEYSKGESWKTNQTGLFIDIYVHGTDGTVKDLTMSGTITMNITSDTFIGSLAGARKNSSNTSNNVTLTNVNTKDMTLSGAQYVGGLIGYINYGNDWTFENCSYSGLNIYSNAKGDTDNASRAYSGGYIGRIENANNYKLYIKTTSETVLENSTIAADATSYAFVGAILGKSQRVVFVNCNSDGSSKSADSPKLTLSGVTVKGGTSTNSYVGGLMGDCIEKVISGVDYTVAVNNVVMSDVKVYNGSASGVNRTGGVIGFTEGIAKMDNISIDGLRVLNYGLTGGVVGAAKKNISFTNISVENSVIASFSHVAIDKDSSIGGLVGKTDEAINTLTGFNILLNNNIIGYYTKSSGVTYEDVDLMNESTVGIRTVTKVSGKDVTAIVPYDKMTETGVKNNELYKNNSNAATILGKTNNQNTTISLKIVGLSVQGKYRPNEELGLDTQTVTYKSSDSYIIYSDYTGAALTSDKNTVGSVSPWVTVNPVSVISGLEKTVMSDGAAWVGDSLSVGQKIIAEAKSDSTENNLIYSNITSLAEAFNEDYGDKLMSYVTADETNKGYSGEDFPLLVIDTNDSETLTKIIQRYAAILTNENLTDSWSAATTAIDIKTYKWNGSAFTEKESATLKVNSSRVISVSSGSHDNEEGQFTVVTVKYKSPASDSTYSLQIPVLVKKVLNYDIKTVVKSGTDYYQSAYSNVSSIALANHGEPVTAFVTFTYERTPEQWESYLNSGENLIYNFDKTIGLDSEGTLTNGTKLTLVDANNANTSDTDSVQNSAAYYSTYKSGSENVTLSDFTSADGDAWSPLSLCDLLGVHELESGEISDEDTVFERLTDGSTADATVKIGDDYYRRVGTVSEIEIEDGSQLPTTVEALKEINESYGILKVEPKESQLKEFTVKGQTVKYLCEYYFITIETPDKNDTSTVSSRVQNPDGVLALGGDKTDIPVQYDGTLYTEKDSSGKKVEWDYDRYIIGQMYTQKLTFETTDSNFEISPTNLKINGVFKSEITADRLVTEAVASNTAVVINHELDFSLVLQDNSNAQVVSFMPSTRVTVKKYTVEGADADGKTVSCVVDSSANLAKSGTLTADISNFRTLLNNGCTITAEVEIEISSEDYTRQFENAVRESGSDEQSDLGISPKVYSKLGSTGNYLTADKTAQNRYYIGTEAKAELIYDADSREMGINPTELENDPSQIAEIHSTAVYNIDSVYSKVTEQTEENSEQEIEVRYEIALLKKNDSGGYDSVNIDDYLNLSELSADSGEISSDSIKSSEGRWILTDVWKSKGDTDGLKRSQTLNIDFTVNTGSQYEAGDFDFSYGNYQVLVSAQLYLVGDSSIPLSVTAAEDHIIYTNARVRIDKVG